MFMIIYNGIIMIKMHVDCKYRNIFYIDVRRQGRNVRAKEK